MGSVEQIRLNATKAMQDWERERRNDWMKLRFVKKWNLLENLLTRNLVVLVVVEEDDEEE